LSDMPSPDEVVYVIGEQGSNIVKIGRTTDLNKRLGAIQRMCPVPLVVLMTHEGGAELEFGLHKHFARLRSHGEWFRFPCDPLSQVREAIETGAWKLAARRERASRRREPSADDLAREAAALIELDELTTAYREAEEAMRKAREALHEEIVSALRDGVPPSKLTEHTPYDRNHIGRIRVAAGIPAQRPGTVLSLADDSRVA